MENKLNTENKSTNSNADYSGYEELEDKVKELNTDDLVISVHDDADGLISGSLLCHALGLDFDKVKVVFPDVFGQTKDLLYEPDVVLDQTPIDPNYDGLVIDHHPIDERDTKYDLIWDENFCTSRIMYEGLKDMIPEKYHWKMALGMAGDGRDDEVPYSIFQKSPELISEGGYTYGKKYASSIDYSAQHAFIMGKSLINYGTRTGNMDYTMSKLIEADDVIDITNDSWFLSRKDEVKNEMKNLYRDTSECRIQVYGNFAIIRYKSDMRLWIAQDMYSRTKKTVIALNERSDSMSIRGPLAQLVANHLDSIDGISAGGHMHFAGGRLVDKTPEFLSKQIRMLDHEWRDIE